MKKILGTIAAAVLLTCCGQAARAERTELRHDDIVVEKGQVLRGDIATDKTITVDGTLLGDAVSVGGKSVTITGEVIGDVVCVGGEVRVSGKVKGDVASVGGPVGVTGRVTGDISALGGAVTLGSGAEVSGDISALGGAVLKDLKAVHRGEVKSVNLRSMRGALAQAVRLSGSRRGNAAPWLAAGLAGAALAVFLSALLTGFVVLLLPAVFFPENVRRCYAAISGDIWQSSVAGAILLVVFFPGLLLITVSIIGIPLLPFAVLLYALAAVLGLGGFCIALQDRFFLGIKRTGPASLPGQVAAGFGLIAGLMFFGKLIPFAGGVLSLLGFLLLFLGAMAGLGACWLTRLGSRVHTGALFSGQAAAPQQAQPLPPADPGPVI